MNTTKKLLMTLLLALMTANMAAAYDFVVDGIYYFTAGNMAVVTYGDGYNSYHGQVTIPTSVTHDGTTYQVGAIGSHAFFECDALTSVNISSTVTTIGQAAFYHCTALTSVTIPNSVTSIDNYAFGFCSALSSVSMGSSVTSIGEAAFSDCESLTSIVIPRSVKTIVGIPFYRCTALSQLEVESGNTVYDSRNHCNAIIETATGTLLNGCRTTVVPDGVITIGNHAFNSQTGLTDINLPESVRIIGDYAFQGCNGLKSVTFGSGVESINYFAFEGCTSLQEVEFPDALKSLGNYAFKDCSTLTRVSTGNGLTTIGDDAFNNCVALDSVAFGQSIQIIHSNAFMNTVKLRSAILPDNVEAIGHYAFSGSGISLLYLGKNLSGGIGVHAFEWCNNLKSVIVPEGVMNINNDTFFHCISLSQVVLPSTLEKIGSRAFSQCKVLKEITIPDGVITISNRAFFECTGLTSIVIPDGVTDLSSEAFLNCSGLTQVTIGKSVRMLESETFTGCQALSTVYCKAVEPPIMIGNAFARYSDAVLYVPTESVQLYKNAARWERFGLILGMNFDNPGDVNDDDYEYVPFVREGVKWVYYYINTVEEQIPDLAKGKHYLTLEIKGKCEIDDKEYMAMHKYSGNTINMENDTIPIYLREEDKVVYGIIPEGKFYNDCPIGSSYMDFEIYNGQEFILYDFRDPVSYLDGMINKYGDMLPKAYEPAYEDYVDLGGIMAKRYVGMMYGGAHEFSYIEGVGYDTQFDGYTLYMFDGHALGLETTIFQFSHMEKEGNVIYKGYHYIPGDVNGDGEVTIADANSVIDVVIMGGNAGHTRAPAADMDDDGEVNIADVNAIIDIIIKGN